MIDSFYKKEHLTGKYLDPFNGFKEKEMPFEIRHDDITGVTCRILPGRYRIPVKPDIQAYLEKSTTSNCPFCPGLFEKGTPRFTPNISPAGKFQRGKAFLFPNAFPHDRFNCVAIFSDEHFIGLNELTPEAMQDGFGVCCDYFKRIKEVHPAVRFCSINWNYMPPAGGALIHPHIQTIVGENPTSYVARITAKARSYQEAVGSNLWRDLIAYEKETDERFIASTGAIAWMASFAPQGLAGEIRFIFHGKRSFFDLTDNDMIDLLAGLSRIFGYLDGKNFISFNLGLFAGLAENDDLWVQGRVLPRISLLPLGTSDVNYFEKLHDEIICPYVPEVIGGELKDLFQTRKE
ncbi:MAG: hypothetical protein JXA41_13465 [Deltaproteobacteria bacterium]|nr:hypothetical protein [Deltaproteobacteria bacterium]